MPAIFSQDDRIARLITPIPETMLVLLEFSGTEMVNGINHFRVKALSTGTITSIESLLGEPVQVEIKTPLEKPRVFHQIVDSIRYLGPEEDNHVYEFELRPWLWRLSRRINSRIFHEQSVTNILRTVIAEHAGDSALEIDDQTGTTYPIRSYVVQYCESDLNFLCRLMELYGINYHVAMETQRHRLVLTTAGDAFAKAPGPARSFSPLGNRGDQTGEHFEVWSPQRQLTTGVVRLMDYDFQDPSGNMEARREDPRDAAGSNLEAYTYPGIYLTQSDGKAIAKRRLDSYRSSDATVRAQGNAASLGAGMRFDLAAHPDKMQFGEYAVLAAHHFVSNGSFRSSGGAAEGSYNGTFVLTNSANPIAPALQTLRPRIHGPQTAVVVDGADGGLDQFGRIAVKFHWDPQDKSMLCRVSQVWASADWGSMFVPHAGMEVIVEFLDGDPDRPLVTGCVWNDKNKPDFPTNSLTSGFKTVRNNQLFFYDKQGNEEVYIRAEKDMKTVVIADHSLSVGGNQTITVDGGKTENIGGDETHKITGTLKIESDTKIELKVGSSTITIDQTSISLKAMEISIDATAALQTSAGASATHDGGAAMVIKAALININ